MSIKKLDTKQYLVRVNITISPGKYKRLSKKVKSYKEAKETEAKFKAFAKMDASIYFEDAVRIYLSDYKERWKPTTYHVYSTAINAEIVPFFAKIPLNTISAAQIHTWQLQIASHDFSDTYILLLEKLFKHILSYAVKFLNIKKSPFDNIRCVGRSGTKEMNFWTIDEFKKVLTVIPRDTLLENEFRQIMCISLMCGTRIGETLAITLQDINFSKQTISINKTFSIIKRVPTVTLPKTPKAIRVISMPRILTVSLHNYVNQQDYNNTEERVFKDFTQSRVRSFFEKYTKLAGVKKIRLHDLRHSAISYWIHLGLPIYEISRRCGHASPKITYNVYAHMYPEGDAHIANLLQQNKEKWDKQR